MGCNPLSGAEVSLTESMDHLSQVMIYTATIQSIKEEVARFTTPRRRCKEYLKNVSELSQFYNEVDGFTT